MENSSNYRNSTLVACPIFRLQRPWGMGDIIKVGNSSSYKMILNAGGMLNACKSYWKCPSGISRGVRGFQPCAEHRHRTY